MITDAHESPTALGELLSKAMTGDSASFERIMKLHERQVYRTALRILGVSQDAQDASQEVFFRLYKHLSRFDPSRPLFPWLYRVTVNVCNDIRRKRPAVATLTFDIADRPASETDDESAADEQRRIMALALTTLSEKERSAIVLRDIEGLTTLQVAEILGSSETTVRSHICRARIKLKECRDRFLRRRT